LRLVLYALRLVLYALRLVLYALRLVPYAVCLALPSRPSCNVDFKNKTGFKQQYGFKKI
jgi:hypothetical protein